MASVASPGGEGANEDAAAILAYGEPSGVLVIADGVGGERSGTRASGLAVRSIAEALRLGRAADLSLRAAILDGIERANRKIGELGTGGASTIAAVQIEGTVVRPFHVGDSMILVVGQRGKIKHQTIPHGPVGYAVEAGVLDEDEALHHEERNVVSNVVGSSGMRIEVGPHLELAALDTVVVASDGLSDNMFVEEVIEVVRRGPLDEAASALVARCRERMTEGRAGEPSKPDDLTFILYRRGRR